ncbi:LysR family transcriptional regulator [Undibacterium fentianense]|uniref:LysR family transcriptional regulator n=1 Tax=Undibacterium fentianense TaxID=2828728 RepID=A0A941IEW4_9BURK|nr:LysR family transcriptional regulator [Undibacterium fentianense]MBR7799802.1 LysR family transcriptional regulator [Undibacterium fentianense]
MNSPRDVLTPAALAMLQVIADSGSFAAASRQLNMVPSALTYRVRQIEDALDVLLFDRSSRQARLTAAGSELLEEGRHFLLEIDAIANRVKRVATGWEPQLTIAIDSIIDRGTVMDLCEDFFQMKPPTKLKLRTETLSGTLEALMTGQADLALGAVMDAHPKGGLQRELLGCVYFAFAVAPHHPLVHAPEPLSDQVIRQHRAVAIADSVQHGRSMSIGLLSGQDVFTVADLPAKLDAQVRGLGVGFLPTCVAQSYLDTGRLVEKKVERAQQRVQSYYVWRRAAKQQQGKALQWWLEQLAQPVTREALLGIRQKYA